MTQRYGFIADGRLYTASFGIPFKNVEEARRVGEKNYLHTLEVVTNVDGEWTTVSFVSTPPTNDSAKSMTPDDIVNAYNALDAIDRQRVWSTISHSMWVKKDSVWACSACGTTDENNHKYS